jgi:hypothetical protein
LGALPNPPLVSSNIRSAASTISSITLGESSSPVAVINSERASAPSTILACSLTSLFLFW